MTYLHRYTFTDTSGSHLLVTEPAPYALYNDGTNLDLISRADAAVMLRRWRRWAQEPLTTLTQEKLT
jgi:hypothetical protein